MPVLGEGSAQPSSRASLRSGELHACCAYVPAFAEQIPLLTAVLSHDEQLRVQRFRRESDAERFIVGRGLVRYLLGDYLGIPARQLRFTYGAYGKPLCGSSLQFNVSHAGDWVALAFAGHGALGIDIEALDRPVNALELAERFLGAVERQELSRLPDSDRNRAFHRLWTRIEAFLKATGEGLQGLDRCRSLSEVTARCQFVELPVHPDYCSTIAILPSAAGADRDS